MNNKNLASFFILGLAIVAAIIFLLPKEEQSPEVQNIETVPTVESTTDLNLVESDLDSTDLNQVDSELDQIDSYSSEF